MLVKVLALDLERTLIDNAMSGCPRPGLLSFLSFCDEQFERVALFTTVEESDAREVMDDLVRRGHVPAQLIERLEYVAWSGEHKNLAFVGGATPSEVLLVDDDAGWVRPDQQEQWVPITAWDGGPDNELFRVQSEIAGLCAGVKPHGPN